MAALEEVKKMQEQGMAENEIIQSLQQKGMKYKEISEALAQSRIKAAVEEPPQENIISNSSESVQSSGTNSNMQKSMLETPGELAPIQSRENLPQSEEIPSELPQDQQGVEEMASEEYGVPEPSENQYDYQSYDSNGRGLSSDVITEISEQVVSEKLSETRKHLEKVIDFKTTIEAKTDSIEERLKRIENIIDTLQSSILRKVGDYVTNVDDIKKELIETQKSFPKLVPEMRKKPGKNIKE